MAKKIVILDQSEKMSGFSEYLNVFGGFDCIVIDLDRQASEDMVEKVKKECADIVIFEAFFFLQNDGYKLIEEIAKSQLNLIIIAHTTQDKPRDEFQDMMNKGIIKKWFSKTRDDIGDVIVEINQLL